MLPHIEAGFRTAQTAFELDDYNDGYVFGSVLWKNANLRLREAAREEGCPFRANADGSFRYESMTIRHHRVDPKTKLPPGAKRAKAEAGAFQLAFEFVPAVGGTVDETVGSPGEPTMMELCSSVVIGIDADGLTGLHEIFLGRLSKVPGSNKFEWGERITLVTSEYPKATLHAEETVPIPDLVLVDPDQSSSDVKLVDTPAKTARAS